MKKPTKTKGTSLTAGVRCDNFYQAVDGAVNITLQDLCDYCERYFGDDHFIITPNVNQRRFRTSRLLW